MLLEALEILNSAGEDGDSFVTDFALYKVITILTVYSPLLISTLLLSQEYLGKFDPLVKRMQLDVGMNPQKINDSQ